MVKVWDFESGKSVFEFGNAHGDSAITCLTFDFSGRRYIWRVSVCEKDCDIFSHIAKEIIRHCNHVSDSLLEEKMAA